MKKEIRIVVEDLIESARPFLDGNVVDETTGTLPLMEKLEQAINKTEEILKEE